MPLSYESPRFNLRTADLTDVKQNLETVGHIIFDGLWNERFLTGLRAFAEDNFAATPTRATHYDGTLSPELDREFLLELERSGLPAVLRYLLSGDFVVSRTERVLRRADASVPAQFSGLHRDGQLRFCSARGINSKGEFTIWTPLLDCTDDLTPRLLLLHRGDEFTNVFSENDSVSDEGNSYLPVALRPQLAADGLETVAERLDTMFEKLYAARRCYAPKIPFGSAVMFNHDVVHGSYRRRNMTTPRYSLDFRAVGVYRPSPANARYQGVAFRSRNIPDGIYAETMRMISRVTLTASLLSNAMRGDITSARRVRRQFDKIKQRLGSH